MKTFPLKLTDEQHAQIKDKAHDARKSMHQYFIDRALLDMNLFFEPPKEAKEQVKFYKEENVKGGWSEAESLHDIEIKEAKECEHGREGERLLK